MNSYLIVAGVDGSEGGRRALQWAAKEAGSRGGVVQAVLAWSWDGLDFVPIAATYPEVEAQQARSILDREIDAVTRQCGLPLPIAGEAVEGSPAAVLTAAARTADLLVLGSHGHSRIRRTALGSVSEECIRKAACPVVVIPVPADHHEPSAEPALRT